MDADGAIEDLASDEARRWWKQYLKNERTL